MNIIQEPNNSGLYFHSSIPDIIIGKTDASTEITFELLKAGISILAEKYVYDSDSKITVHNLTEIFEKYFDEKMFVPSESVDFIATGLGPLEFTYHITEGATVHTTTFKIVRCDSEMSVDASTWLAKNFLTRSYRGKRTAKWWTEFLSFLQLPAYGICTKNYKLVYLVNGVETELIGTLGAIAVCAAPQIVTANVGIGQIFNLFIPGGEPNINVTVCRFEIWMTGTEFETNKYGYLVDNTPYRTIQPFVFINSFGVLETFTATGQIYDAKKAVYTFSQIDRRYKKIANDFKSEKTCNSGYLSEAEMDWLDDFIRSFAVGVYNFQNLLVDEITVLEVEKNNSNANELMAFSFNYRRSSGNHLQFIQAANGLFDRTFDNTFE